jgi:small subunit ribosomal protein S17
MSDETKDTAQPEETKSVEAAAETPTGFKRRLAGRVKSNKMAKTVVVQVVRYFRHPVYKKYVRSRTSYKAHDEESTCRVGDRVEIIESRPLSREKRWKVVRVIERAVID